MPPRRRSTAAKRAKGLAKAAEILGVSVEDLPQPTKFVQTAESRSLEAMSCIVFLDTGGREFTRQVCSECNRLYAVQYAYRSRGLLCSDECRHANLARRGLGWDRYKDPSVRWNKRVPIVVPPEVLPILEELVNGKAQEVTEPIESPDVGNVLDAESIDIPPVLPAPIKVASLDDLFP